MASGFIDSLKLVLSDKYALSDSDYQTLSDILLTKGLSDSAFDSGLVQMIYLMVKYKHSFPISLTFLKELWEYENVSFNFVGMLGSLLKNKVITLRKVKKETFLKDDSITKSNTEVMDSDIYVVIYGSKIFNEIFYQFKEVLEKDDSSILEGVSIGIPKKVRDMIQKAGKLLKNLSVKVEVESYINDSALNSSRLNLILSQTSKYKYKDSDILRIAKKHVKGKGVLEVESYIEDESELFLGIDLSGDESTYRDIADRIYGFVEELEVEGV